MLLVSPRIPTPFGQPHDVTVRGNVREGELQLDFSKRGRSRVILITVLGTLLCLAAAVATVAYTTQFMPHAAQVLTWLAALLIPLGLSAPIFYYFANTMRKLALAHDELAVIAAQDSLTTCLNRGAFLTLVDSYLRDVRDAGQGAMLVVDADHFKSVNDQFGHAAGDKALKLIVGAMQSVIRPIDLIGRIGGEEFAVFLPKTDQATARTIAERVRTAVNTSLFVVGGNRRTLSVSVGAAMFSGRVDLDTLLARADDMMYAAKNQGRNRVAFSPVNVAA